MKIGQIALLRLSAFNQRTTPEINGTVTRISADASTDQRTGQTYYTIRIAMPPEEVAKLGEVRMVPGMPVEAFVQTGERTMISYLLKPLQRSTDARVPGAVTNGRAQRIARLARMKWLSQLARRFGFRAGACSRAVAGAAVPAHRRSGAARRASPPGIRYLPGHASRASRRSGRSSSSISTSRACASSVNGHGRERASPIWSRD